MMRNIKALLAFVAVAAMSMVAAGGAQAAQLHAATAGPEANIEGQQTTQHVFRITPPNGPAVTCTQAIFEGSAAITASHGIITGRYTGCTAFGQAATVRMNGCKYTIDGAGKAALTAEVDVVGCTAGKQIEVQTAICQIKVPAQTTIGGHLVFSNVAAAPAHVNANITATGIQYQVSGAVCGHTVNTTTSDGTYNGAGTFKSFVKNATQKATHEGHEYDKINNGAQVALTAT